jgi:hypothetical protein
MARRPRNASPSARIPWKSLTVIGRRELARELKLEKEAQRAAWRDKAAVRRHGEIDLIARGVVTRAMLRSAAESRRELMAARLDDVRKAERALRTHRGRRHGKARMRDISLMPPLPGPLLARLRPMSFRLGAADSAVVVEDWHGSGDGVVLRNPPASLIRSASLGDAMTFSVMASAGSGIAWYTALGNFVYAFAAPIAGTLSATISCANSGTLVMSAPPKHFDPWPWEVAGATQLWANCEVSVYRMQQGGTTPTLVGFSPATPVFTIQINGYGGANFLSTPVSSAPRLAGTIQGFPVTGGDLLLFTVRHRVHTWAADGAAASVNFTGVGAGVGVSNVDVMLVP